MPTLDSLTATSTSAVCGSRARGGRDIYTTPRPVTISIEGATKIYDGTPLTSDRYTMTEGTLAEGDRLEVSFDTSLTDVGRVRSVANYKMINAAGEDMTQHYEITEMLGYLEVLAREVVIKTDDLTVVYDAKPHSNKGYHPLSPLALAEGHTLHADDWAEITNAGSVVNAFSSYRVLDAAGNDVTENYVITTSEVLGTLTVNPRPITVQTADAEKIYDGTALELKRWDVIVGALMPGHTVSALRSWTAKRTSRRTITSSTVKRVFSLLPNDSWWLTPAAERGYTMLQSIRQRNCRKNIR